VTFPICNNVPFNFKRGPFPSFVTFQYTITKFNKFELDGLTPNNRVRDVMNIKEAFEKTIDEALTGNFVAFASQVKTAFPENLNNCTSPPSPPEPIPANVPLAVIFPPRTDKILMNEIPPFAPLPAPIPAPELELLAVIFPFKIVRFPTAEVPLSPYPLPIPEPYDELLAVIFPFKIVRFQTVELPESRDANTFQGKGPGPYPYPLPIPEPYDELLAVIFPFKIVRFQTVELPERSYPYPHPLPIPEPYDELLAVIFPFNIVRL
jgi:hypothetical protein